MSFRDDDPFHTPVAQELANLVEPLNDCSPAAAAAKIDALARSDIHCAILVAEFGNHLFDFATKIPWEDTSHALLVDLVKALKEAGPIWRDSLFVEEGFSHRWAHDCNAIGLVARLLVEGLCTQEVTWQFIKSFSVIECRAAPCPPRIVEQRDFVVEDRIQSALVWMVLAGDYIYDSCLSDVGRRYTHMEGFCEGRWESWKDTAAEMAEEYDWDEDTREAAELLKQEMDEVQERHEGGAYICHIFSS